jgi:hypothetical protein
MKTSRGIFPIAGVVLLFAANQAHAFFDPNIGRFLNRDPIGEKGGPNLYAFVANNPLGFIDPFGTDFIAVASRPVRSTLGQLDHYSIQYWLACSGEAPKVEQKIADWQWHRNGTKKIGSVQLLRDEGWKIWRLDDGTWKLADTSISVIHFSDSGEKFISLFEDSSLSQK